MLATPNSVEPVALASQARCTLFLVLPWPGQFLFTFFIEIFC